MSQSIKSDRINESTIARMAGNILSGYLVHDATDVVRAVALARAIAAEVERTRPVKAWRPSDD